MNKELRKLGAKTEEGEDYLVIELIILYHTHQLILIMIIEWQCVFH